MSTTNRSHVVGAYDGFAHTRGDRLLALISHLDNARRRGVWSYVDRNTLALYAGREGDDVRLELHVGDVVTEEHLRTFEDIEARGQSSLDDYLELAAVVRCHLPYLAHAAQQGRVDMPEQQLKVLLDAIEQLVWDGEPPDES